MVLHQILNPNVLIHFFTINYLLKTATGSRCFIDGVKFALSIKEKVEFLHPEKVITVIVFLLSIIWNRIFSLPIGQR